MLLQDLHEGKKRPNKTLHFNRYDLWAYDIASRYPDVEKHSSDDRAEVVAIDKKTGKCLGMWDQKLSKGISYKEPRNAAHVLPWSKRVKKFE